MIEQSSLVDQFLIAMPNMADGNFTRSLTYICEHSGDGAMGIIVNRPGRILLGEILGQLSIHTEYEEIYSLPVYQGGPVQPERGFVLHNDNSIWDSTLSVARNISVTTSKDILQAIANNEGPKKILMALGYAGWASNQLERELTENAWLCGPADEQILFTLPPQQRLAAAAGKLGVDLNLISLQTGHA